MLEDIIINLNKTPDLCPVCFQKTNFSGGTLGDHVEGLLCKNCGANCRNRFLYWHFLLGIFEMKQNQMDNTLRTLEVSSYGYKSLNNSYIERHKQFGSEILCGDFYERDFQSEFHVDLRKLKFPDNSFNFIIHSHVLEHVDDDITAISECYRCLEPGGCLIFSLPIQTDFTFAVTDEYHGDAALVYRRNGWDIIGKLRSAGFHVEVRVPPEHMAITLDKLDKETLVLDNIRLGDKFGLNYVQYQSLFYKSISKNFSSAQHFSACWGGLELFYCRKVYNM